MSFTFDSVLAICVYHMATSADNSIAVVQSSDFTVTTASVTGSLALGGIANSQTTVTGSSTAGGALMNPIPLTQ